MVHDGRVGVARGVKDPSYVAISPEPVGELPAAHQRHHDIGEQEVDIPLVALFREPDRFAAILCLKNRIPFPAEHPGGHTSNRLLIINQQHDLPAPWRPISVAAWLGGCDCATHAGQVYLECRPLTEFAVHGYMAPVLLDDAIAG